MKYFKIPVSTIIIMVSACNFGGKTKSNPESAMDWSTLIIRSEGSTEIRIDNDNDSTFVTTKPPFDILYPLHRDQ